MDQPDLIRFYRPRSIAVVGAHDTRAGLSGVTRKAIDHAALCGASFTPVNPRRESVYGIPCVASLADVTGPVDVVVVLVGDAEAVVEQAIAAGLAVGFFLVFSNGYSELGSSEGRAREERLAAAVRLSGARMVGPNTNVNAWDPVLELPGRRLAAISQSGIQGRALTQAQELGIALSYWAPTGNEADLDATDFIRFFAADPETAAICAYVEGLVSGDRLRTAAAEAIEQSTPIVLVKVGRSAAGASMAQSHTGHLAGADEVWDAFFAQYGMVRVDDFDQLVQVGAALARCPVPAADGVVVCSVSGGSSAHVADLAEAAGLRLPVLTEATQERLRAVVPAGFRVDNPVDNGGTVVLTGAGPEVWNACLDDPGVGLMLCPVPASAPGLTDGVGATLAEVARTVAKPILPIWSGPSTQHPAYRQIWDAGLPVFSNVRNAIAAAHALLGHPSRSEALREQVTLTRSLPPLPTTSGPDTLLEEAEATAWLAERGLPFARHLFASDVDGAAAAAAEIGYPVVLKGRGAGHKSEHGFVAVGLAAETELRHRAAVMLSAGATGLLVAELARGGVELLAGVTLDPSLGPVVVVGAGGVTAEAVRDVARGILPLRRARAEEMLDSLRIAPLLGGFRGSPPLDRAAVVDTLLRLAEIAASGEVAEIDVNPLLVRQDGVLGLDALVRLREPAGPTTTSTTPPVERPEQVVRTVDGVR